MYPSYNVAQSSSQLLQCSEVIMGLFCHVESKDFYSFSKRKSQEITVIDYVIDLISLMG